VNLTIEKLKTTMKEPIGPATMLRILTHNPDPTLASTPNFNNMLAINLIMTSNFIARFS
jgi:hypothetical protein